MVNGNISGLSRQMIENIDHINDMVVPREDFFSQELVELLCKLTGQINREISVYINRRGEVLDVSIGELSQVALPYMRLRRSDLRLSGVRCIHTHPGGSGVLSRVDLQSLQSMRFDAMAALGVSSEGFFTDGYAALLNAAEEENNYTILGPLDIKTFCGEKLNNEISLCDVLIGVPNTVDTLEGQEERAILVGLDDHGDGARSLNELEELANTAGAIVLQRITQNRKTPERATYIGKGKASELALVCQGLGVNLAVFDDELTAVQMKNLEDILGVRIIDRTALILEIFSKRAVSREGKLQVELAQQKYRLPRLMGMGRTLSRLGGGIGTRGPGEKKLETDRRHIRRRINEIEEELSKVKDRRESLRQKRQKEQIPICALVGYTNTGKSTLLNLLSGSDVLAENKLFATLDPISRGITLPNHQQILLIDTVGFIDKLPHHLVEAFQSSLEEVVQADLLLHVVDAGSLCFNEHMMVVQSVLHQLGANQPVITIYNKMDTVEDPALLPVVRPQVQISALKNWCIDELLTVIEENLPKQQQHIKVLIPFDQGNIRAMLHRQSHVLDERYEQEGTYMEIEADELTLSKVKKYTID